MFSLFVWGSASKGFKGPGLAHGPRGGALLGHVGARGARAVAGAQRGGEGGLRAAHHREALLQQRGDLAGEHRGVVGVDALAATDLLLQREEPPVDEGAKGAVIPLARAKVLHRAAVHRLHAMDRRLGLVDLHLRGREALRLRPVLQPPRIEGLSACLLYNSDAADEYRGVDLGGCRIIKKKKKKKYTHQSVYISSTRLFFSQYPTCFFLVLFLFILHSCTHFVVVVRDLCMIV